MIDLISRQAAIDAVENCEPGEELFVIKSLPSIDAVQVVRCKDCKYKECYYFPPKYVEKDFCGNHDRVVDEYDFCSMAERKES